MGMWHLQKKPGGEKHRRWVLWKTSAENNNKVEESAKEEEYFKDVREDPKLAIVTENVEKILMLSSKQRYRNLQEWGALRIQTAFRAFLVSRHLVIPGSHTLTSLW
jgi:hypothetical protein